MAHKPMLDPSKPFSHLCRHGIQIDADRCDLRGGVTVRVPEHEATLRNVAEAVAQAFGYHAANILPMLPAFGGYDAISVSVIH